MKNKCKCDFKPVDLLFFNKLIVPSILTVIYWVVLLFTVLAGILVMLQSFFAGLISIVVGVVSVRITFELICVLFSINKNLEKLVSLQSPNVESSIVEPLQNVTETPKEE